MSYKVKLGTFEGPFDLLVYLIESAKMNIYDIQVSEITSQYVRYIEEMQQMNVALSSEFIVLASELIELKSRMLLPRIKVEGEEAPEEDPRSQLVERILEYKKYKNISEFLGDCEEEALKIKEKPQEDLSQYRDAPDEYLTLDMGQFVNAFNQFLHKKKKVEEIKNRYERIQREKITAQARINFIASLFAEDRNKTINFKDTIQQQGDKYDTALSFSSMLEMVKHQRIIAEQKSLFADILINATEDLDKEVTSSEQ